MTKQWNKYLANHLQFQRKGYERKVVVDLDMYSNCDQAGEWRRLMFRISGRMVQTTKCIHCRSFSNLEEDATGITKASTSLRFRFCGLSREATDGELAN